MKRQVLIIVAVFVCCSFLSACGAGQVFGPTFTPTPTVTSTPTNTPTPTETPKPTLTPTVDPGCLTDDKFFYPDIPLSETTSTIDDSGCADAWIFSSKKGTELLMTMVTTSGNLPADFSLWTTAGDSCTSCNDISNVAMSEGTSAISTIKNKLPYTGDYYVIMTRPYSNLSGTYTFSIEYVNQPTATARPVVIQPTKAIQQSQPTSTSDAAANLGTVPVTITNNTSHDMKIVAIGPASYTVKIQAKQTLDVNWAPGNYTLTAYYSDGTYYASTNYDVNENHAIFTLN